MINFKNVKLIIWDLDETLWNGTLSDVGKIKLNDSFVKFINDSLDRGIVHSICSKNDYDVTKRQLEEMKLWELFVFPSISWDAKAARVKWIVESMALRPQNVLFVDDNDMNLREVKSYYPQITCCSPQMLEESLTSLYELPEKKDDRKRLKQYRILEEKNQNKVGFLSNEDFLKSCNIKVEIHHDCIENIDRISELIARSNQLNYTKFRQDKYGLIELIKEPDVQSGYVKVTDDYGDYGIVGFYAVQNQKAVHFLFSCRTLGMLVEQYVYVKIGCPQIDVRGDVATQLDNTTVPVWINADNSINTRAEKDELNKRILFKGPCDTEQIFSFIKETPLMSIDFSYTNGNGVLIEGHNHTSGIFTAMSTDVKLKADMLSEFSWFDERMFDDKLLTEKYDMIVLSMVTDAAIGLYKRKDSNAYVALCEKKYDITAPCNRKAYIEGTIFTSNIKFTERELDKFAEIYEYVPDDNYELSIKMLDYYYKKIDKKTKLVLVLGSEIPYEGKKTYSYEERELEHKKLNTQIRKWADGKKNVYLIESGKYIHSQNDYIDTITHYKKKVYYDMAKDIANIAGMTGTVKGIKSLIYNTFRQNIYFLAKRLGLTQ